MKNIILIFLIILIIIFLLLITYITYKNKNIESFSANTSLSSFSKKHILDDCINNWAKISNASNPELFCETNSWITNPKYLCGICGDSEENPLYSFNFQEGNGTNGANESDKISLFGCTGTLWSPPANNTIKKVNSYLSNKQTCNLTNINAKSNMYIYICADDNCTVSLNNKNIITQTGWNQLGVYLIKDVNYGDVVSIEAINTNGAGGMCVSYIWNGQLYILDNNGFENSANIINYKLSITKIWSSMWSDNNNVVGLLPWMNNWISLENAPGNTYGILSFKIGDMQKIDLLTNDLTIFLGIDNSGKVYINNNLVYNKTTPSNQISTLSIPNVDQNDILRIEGVNSSGAGGIGITYLWCGMLYTLPSSLQQFNSVANIISYKATNCSEMTYECSHITDNLQFMTNWLKAGKDNFTFIAKISDNSYQYGPSISTWYTIKQNNYVGPWSITNIKSNLSMTITFTINIKTIFTWRNILHVSNQNINCCDTGSRLPGIWVTDKASSLCIINGTSTNGNDYFYTTSLPLNTPTNVKIIWSGNNVNVYFNSMHNVSYTYTGTITPIIPTASFYIGDPWYTQDGNVLIKDFKINNDNNDNNNDNNDIDSTDTHKYIDQNNAEKDVDNNINHPKPKDIIHKGNHNDHSKKYINEGVDYIKKYGKEGVNNINKYGKEGVDNINKYGKEGIDDIKKYVTADNIKKYVTVGNIKKYGAQGVKEIKKIFKKHKK